MAQIGMDLVKIGHGQYLMGGDPHPIASEMCGVLGVCHVHIIIFIGIY